MTTKFREEPVDSIDLSFVADALLAMCEHEPDAPYYTEDGFETRLHRIRKRESTAADELISGKGDVMLAIECRDVLIAAGLTARQHEVLELRLEGFTFEEIGGFGRTSKQAAMNVFVQALKKITRTFRDYPYAGLSEVYGSEVKRRSRGHSFGTMVR